MEVGGSRWLYHVGRFFKFKLCMQYTIYVLYHLSLVMIHDTYDTTHTSKKQNTQVKKNFFRQTLYQFDY